MSYLPRFSSLIGVVGLAAAAHAAPTTFFGEDTNGGSSALSHPNADAARANFFSNLSGVGTETFESFAAGTTTPLVVNFSGAGTATLTGTGSVTTGQFDRFAISGTKYYETNGTFALGFSAPISAFGFYGTDLGDVGASLSLTLIGSNGTTTLAVPNIVNSTTGNGSALYFGFYDTANTYTSISFNGAGSDVFGFDDFSIGTRAQVVPSQAPEPASWAMMIAGFGAIGAAMRRRKGAIRFA